MNCILTLKTDFSPTVSDAVGEGPQSVPSTGLLLALTPVQTGWEPSVLGGNCSTMLPQPMISLLLCQVGYVLKHPLHKAGVLCGVWDMLWPIFPHSFLNYASSEQRRSTCQPLVFVFFCQKPNLSLKACRKILESRYRLQTEEVKVTDIYINMYSFYMLKTC